MSSLRYGFSTPYRMTVGNSARLFNIVEEDDEEDGRSDLRVHQPEI